MRTLRLLLSIALAVYMTGAGHWAMAQDADTSPFSITLAPLQYANVKGSVANFEALNWMPNGAVEGGSISFVKDINKDISLNIEGSEYTNDDGNGEMTLKDGDLAFLRIDYNAFRKYYDAQESDYPYKFYNTTYTLPGNLQGDQPNSPDLQVDISYFKLEAGLGPISDPFLDVSYQHNSKDGDKSFLENGSAYFYNGGTITGDIKKLGPGWESLNDTTDTVTIKEKKDLAGITIKGEQTAEVDYNHDTIYSQYLSENTTGTDSQLDTETEYADAKLFGSGIRAEKWMLNDNTYTALGYHYNHIGNTDYMETQVLYPESISGVIVLQPQATRGNSLWSSSKVNEDDHVWVGNLNTNLTPNLVFLADARYEHMGSHGSSDYYANTSGTADVTVSDIDRADMQNHQDQTGEHVALHYYGLPHTTLYVESEMEQERNWVDYSYIDFTPTNNFTLERLDRTENESWTVGARVVPNRFFTLSTQVKAHNNDNQYDTINYTGVATGDILMDSLREKGVDETSTLTWRPYHWLQNSLKYQFSDTVYNPQLAADDNSSNDPLIGSAYNITENHMLTSQFTYDISVQPIDPLLLMLTYSHVENYVRTLGASTAGAFGAAGEGGPTFIPDFNSGDNSWLFSSSYMPLDNLTWTNSVCYTISNNYVDDTIGVPLGTSFRELNFSSGLDWTYHKWLKVSPGYEHASYRDNPLIGTGNYSANIFKLTFKFTW